MNEIVVKLGLRRERGFLYFFRGTDVYKAPLSRAGGPSVAGKAEKVATAAFKRESGYLYYLDKNGDVSRVRQRVGGQVGVSRRRTTQDKVTSFLRKRVSATSAAISDALDGTAVKDAIRRLAARGSIECVGKQGAYKLWKLVEEKQAAA